MSLRVLVASSEVVGFAKTGGLADVAGALPRAIAARGHRVAVVMPLYRGVRQSKTPIERTNHVIPVTVGTRTLACRVYRSHLPGSAVPIYFIEQPEYFERDDPATGRGIYQQSMPGGYKADYPDNAERFAFFSRAVLEVVSAIGFVPDIIHANDWQTGLVPAYLSEIYRARTGFKHTRSVFTIHNIAYQGTFGADVMRVTNLPGYLFNDRQMEFHGKLNFLKTGIVFADAVNTVSPTYARETQTTEYGGGLDGVLVEHRDKYQGIMNGVDYEAWNPDTDKLLSANYNATTVFEKKPILKTELQKRYNLPPLADRPLLGVVARLVSQKGIDLILSAAPGFLDLGCQLVFLGEGDPEYHQQLEEFRVKHPTQVGIYLGYSEALAHLVEAGCDFFLMPSRYEPSGLNQLYSLKYGTPPIVRATGGLADSVTGATPETIANQTATGMSFREYTAAALFQTVKTAVSMYRDQPKDFQAMILRGMGQDWSWSRSAADYEQLYQRVLSR